MQPCARLYRGHLLGQMARIYNRLSNRAVVFLAVARLEIRLVATRRRANNSASVARRITNRWTRAAGPPFAINFVRRRGVLFSPPRQLHPLALFPQSSK